jgi:hypothetical protein
MSLRAFLGLAKSEVQIAASKAVLKESKCNYCGGHEFIDMNGRPAVRCAGCGSLERTRTVKLLIDHFGLAKAGTRVLHFAPEKSLSKFLIQTVGENYYDARDISPDIYKHTNVRRFDLTEEVHTLPANQYDLILHNHVLEHLACNITAVLFHLHRSLRAGGTHLFSVPIFSEYYSENIGPLNEAERIRRFGQHDHVRAFGATDLQKTIGMIFRIPDGWNLTTIIPAETFDLYNVPRHMLNGFHQHGIFMLKKQDLLHQE